MIKDFIDIELVVKDLIKNTEDEKYLKFLPKFSERDYKFLKIIIKICSPIFVVLSHLEGEKYPTSSIILIMIILFKNHIKKLIQKCKPEGLISQSNIFFIFKLNKFSAYLAKRKSERNTKYFESYYFTIMFIGSK